MKLTHLGHACLLVETDGARLLVDPGAMSAFEDVRDLDAVLVTHQHADHVDAARLGTAAGGQPRRRAGGRPRHGRRRGGPAGDSHVARPGDRLIVRRHHGRRPRRPARRGLRRRARLHERGLPRRRRRPAAPRRLVLRARRATSTCWRWRSTGRGSSSPRRSITSARYVPGWPSRSTRARRPTPASTPACSRRLQPARRRRAARSRRADAL